MGLLGNSCKSFVAEFATRVGSMKRLHNCPEGHYCATNSGSIDATSQVESQGVYCLLGKMSEVLETK